LGTRDPLHFSYSMLFNFKSWFEAIIVEFTFQL
jgi:hypothetical protein